MTAESMRPVRMIATFLSAVRCSNATTAPARNMCIYIGGNPNRTRHVWLYMEEEQQHQPQQQQ